MSRRETIVDRLLPGGRGARLGLDLGQGAVKAVRLSPGPGGGWQAEGFLLDRRQEGIVDDEDLATHLPGWLRDHGLTGCETVLGVPPDISRVQVTAFPSDAMKALPAMVAFQTRQLAELSEGAFLHDHCTMPRRGDGQIPVLIGVCLESLIEDRVGRYAPAVPHLADLGMNSLGVINAFLDVHPAPSAGQFVLLLDIGAESTVMAVLNGAEVVFCGSLACGVERYRTALAEAAAAPPPAPTPRRPQLRGRAPSQGPVADQAAQALLHEIRAGLDEWREAHGHPGDGARLSAVWVSGGGACLPELVGALSRSLGCEAAILRPPLPAAGDQAPLFATAYGLALQAAGQAPMAVSLAPPRMLWQARRRRRSGILAAAVATLTLLLATVLVREVTRLRERRVGLAAELENLSRCETVTARIEETAAHIRGLESVQIPLVEYGSRAGRFAATLAVLGDACGPDDWLVYVGDGESYEAGKGAAAPGGERTARRRCGRHREPLHRLSRRRSRGGGRRFAGDGLRAASAGLHGGRRPHPPRAGGTLPLGARAGGQAQRQRTLRGRRSAPGRCRLRTRGCARTLGALPRRRSTRPLGRGDGREGLHPPPAVRRHRGPRTA